MTNNWHINIAIKHPALGMQAGLDFNNFRSRLLRKDKTWQTISIEKELCAQKGQNKENAQNSKNPSEEKMRVVGQRSKAFSYYRKFASAPTDVVLLDR